VRLEADIVAFANLWLGAGHEELSVDLMRHPPDAPSGTMDFLSSEPMR
jgi:phosphatidylglycerol lysyltransferase